MLVAPAVFAATSVSYPENGTDPVATFSATDQDGDAIVWSLGGADEAKFNIDGGVLTFKSPPNYESPDSKSVGTLANRNVYNVTVQATGGSEEVVVSVTNVDEDGSVSFIGQGRFQPQVGRGLEATLSDPDKGPLNTYPTDEAWQWARSSDGTTWTDIEGATAPRRSPVAADEGHYLRASVTYTDEFGSGKMVEGVAANKVEERTLANAAPSFAGQDDNTTATGTQVNRSMDENTAVGVNIGRPVSASDGDGDLLIYTLEDTPDLKDGNDARFTIDRASGQIKAAKKLDFETAEDEDSVTQFDAATYPWLNDTTGGATAFTAAATNVYILLVKATDPSGAGTTQPVAVTVSDVNEAPAFDAGSAVHKVVNVVENTVALRTGADSATALPADAYNANDEDADQALGGTTTPVDNETEASVTLEGADAKYFTIDDAGLLSVDQDQDNDGTNDYMPNFEKQSSYSITVVATSGTGNRLLKTRLDVTVHVIDAEDGGTVSLSQREPQAGRTVVATLSDPDGGVILSKWAWETSDALTAGQTCAADAANWAAVVPSVTSGAYTPKTADNDKCLRATATYTDNIPGDSIPADTTDNDGDAATDANMDGIDVSKVSEFPVQLSEPDNTAPKFQDQDLTTDGDQSDETTRSVPENMADENVGGPVVATDDDQDALMFTISDTDNFKTDNNGQIQTKVKLDFETQDTYVVALTATDPSGASDSIMVTIMVEDGPDDAAITLVTGPAPDDPVDTCGGATAGTSLVADCRTLLEDIEDALVGDGGTALNWDEDTPIADWDGVLVGANGRVVNIFLADLGLAGVVPAGLNDLTGLVRLTLRDNDLTGEIPDLSALDSLEVLNLKGNALTGSVPATLGDLDSIDSLWLYSNDLTGSIPSELGDATSLRRLYLHDNMLSGDIPAELGNLSRLRYLWLHRNELTGGIPTELGNLTNLKALYLYSNNLTGSIPAELGSIMTDADDTLRLLYLHDNMLSGDIPAELGNLTSLTRLLLRMNDLTGCIPAAIAGAAEDADRAGLSACDE